MLDPYTTVAASNGGAYFKRPNPPLFIPAGHAAFRILCHASRIGGVIGKSGLIIKQLQQDTSARIRVEDSPPSSGDRVIIITASNAINRKIELDGEEFELSAAQEAVVKVFERILDVAAESDGVAVAEGGLVSCRLISEPSHAGSVIGKGGKVVEKIKKDTGTKIRVLNHEKMPACAYLNDEMVEIEGDYLAVKKALVSVTRCLQDCSPADKSRTIMGRPHEAVPREMLADLRMDLPLLQSSVQQPMLANSLSNAPRYPLPLDIDRVPPMNLRMSQQELTFRILCTNERVGAVIGKGGTVVRSIQNESGASISVGAPIPGCEERLVTITATENPESRYSPAQSALLLVFNRSTEAGMGKGIDSNFKSPPVSAQLVILSNQVGCLLGKGGSIISEMRKATGAFIRIIGGDQVPQCVPENDQVVQITGEFASVQDALYNVSGRLRANQFPSGMQTGAGIRSRDPSFGLPSSVGISNSANRPTTLSQSMDNLSLSRNVDGPPSPRSWTPQSGAGSNSRSIMDVGKGSNSVKGGIELGSGNRSAVVTNTTVEIVVPENVIGSVVGENGSNLARLRQISGAKVMVHEPQPGTTNQVVIISGSPDETQAAQSLLQAFILTGSS